MGLPFSPFLLFGTLCLLGTSLRLIGTRSVNLIALHLHIGAGLFTDCMHWNQVTQCFFFTAF